MIDSPITRVADALLRTLGRHSRQEYLLHTLRQCGLDASMLLCTSVAADRPYPVAWPAQGLSLLVQHLPAHEHGLAESSWGLHSLTFDAQRWPGAWIKGLDPAQTTSEDLINRFAEDRSEALCLPDMACVCMSGFDNQGLSVVALFDPVHKRLSNLTLTRMGRWIGMSVLPPWSAG